MIITQHSYIKKQSKEELSLLKYSIVIPSWNNLRFLQLAIKSIKKNSTFKHQILIVVNEGIDHTLEWLVTQPDIDFVHAEKNLGVCYAMNCARTYLKTNYLMFLNDDMYLCPNWDVAIDKEIKRLGHNNFFISGTIIEYKNTNPNAQSIFKNYGLNIDTFEEEKLLKEYQSLFVENWNGSSWPPSIVHLSTWDAVGGYSIEYGLGMYSDPDFSKKLWEYGIREFIGLGNSLVYHFTSETTKRIKKNNGSNIFLSKWRFTVRTFYKHYLKMGQPYNGKLDEVILSASVRFINHLKLLLQTLKKK